MMSGNASIGSDNKIDPVLVLDEECLIQILSFVLGGTTAPLSSSSSSSLTLARSLLSSKEEEKELVGDSTSTTIVTDNDDEGTKLTTIPTLKAQHVFSYYSRLVVLSRGWKTMMENVITRCVPSLSVRFDDDSGSRAADPSSSRRNNKILVNWLCKHQLPIKVLENVITLDSRRKCIEQCNVEYLESCLSLRVLAPSDKLIASVLSSKGCCPSRSSLLGVGLFDTLSRNCPRLSTMNISFGFDVGSPSLLVDDNIIYDSNLNTDDVVEGTGTVSPLGSFQSIIRNSPLFSHPTAITKLKIHVHVVPASVTVGSGGMVDFQDARFFSRVIQNLPLLEQLELSSRGSFQLPRRRDCPGGRLAPLQISSPSLRRLDVSNLFAFRSRVPLILDCPRLQKFVCKAMSLVPGPGDPPGGDVELVIIHTLVRATDLEDAPNCTVEVKYHFLGRSATMTCPWRGFFFNLGA